MQRLLYKAHVFQDRLGLVSSHTTDTQCSDLSPSPQSLKSYSNLPPFLFLQNENVSFPFRISDRRPKYVQTFVFATL